MSGTVPDPSVVSDKAWLERAEKRARRCVRNPTAYPSLAARHVGPLVAELDRLRTELADLQASNEKLRKRDLWLADLLDTMQKRYASGLEVLAEVALERDRHRRVRRRLWEILGRPDGVGLDAELLDAVSDLKHPAASAPGALRRAEPSPQETPAAARWRAPFTADQAAALNGWQTDGRCHPYTCPSDAHDGECVLYAKPGAGWVCPGCDYTQDWAHATEGAS